MIEKIQTVTYWWKHFKKVQKTLKRFPKGSTKKILFESEFTCIGYSPKFLLNFQDDNFTKGSFLYSGEIKGKTMTLANFPFSPSKICN